MSTPIIASNDGGRTPTYALSNPWPNGIQAPPGSSLGPQTFLGRGPSFSNPDFVVPNVHQFSAGIQRELPWRISLEVTYAGSRSYDIEGELRRLQRAVGGVPGAVRRHAGRQPHASATSCCRTRSSASPGFEGTTRFTNPTLSRFELSRPFPAFTGFSQNQKNIGKLMYDSAQFVANKRWAKGVTINASYTWVPRWTEDRRETTTGIGNAYVDEVSLLNEHGPYFSQRKHRITASGVWELPGSATSAASPGYLLGGWSIAPMLVYQSRPAVGHARQRRSGAGRRSRRRSRCRARRKGSSSTA